MKIKLKNYELTWKDWGAIGIAFGLFLGVIVLTFSRDISMPYHVWVNGFKNSTYERGDYVMFRLAGDNYTSNKRLVKIIMCGPGDKIRRVENAIFCNSKWICNVLEKDLDGNALPQLQYDETIPENYYFLAGTHERSYDSRYFGLVHGDAIERQLYSLAEILGL